MSCLHIVQKRLLLLISLLLILLVITTLKAKLTTLMAYMQSQVCDYIYKGLALSNLTV